MSDGGANKGPLGNAARAVRGSKLVLLLVLILVVGTALGLMSNTLSPTVSREITQVDPNITLTVTGVPPMASAGDVISVVATLQNNANRPVPAVLRFEIRNPGGIEFDEITVYAQCGAEERVSSKTLTYYIGWHGPLLAPNGTHFPTGTSVEQIETTLGARAHWEAVFREIQERDPQGYEALIDPGLNASIGVRATFSEALKILYYYGMVRSSDDRNPSASAWRLTLPFSGTLVATGGASQYGFSLEISPAAKGSYEFEFWAELPDRYGMPNHEWTCGPL
ncbi:MAG: hypothetical protein ACE5I4_08050 [Thermoplasmata archaeon]